MSDSVLDGPRLGKRDFDTLSDLIEKHAGIRMPASKRTMLEGRLRRRLKECGMNNFDQYCRFLFKDGGLDDELTNLIDVVTTNKTEFFREPGHFEFLTRRIVPDLMHRGIGVQRPLRVWSAACSTGPEPYTLAMVLSEVRAAIPGFDFHILATDISTSVLRAAARAIYPEAMAEPIPLELRKKYLLRSRDRTAGRIRMAPEIRNKVEFRHLNFMDPDYRLQPAQDVVFCRNVLIYFDNDVRKTVLTRICRYIPTAGYLVVGHSETLGNIELPVKQVVPTIYLRS